MRAAPPLKAAAATAGAGAAAIAPKGPPAQLTTLLYQQQRQQEDAFREHKDQLLTVMQYQQHLMYNVDDMKDRISRLEGKIQQLLDKSSSSSSGL